MIAKLNAEVNRVLAQPDVQARLEREGAEIVAGPPERLGAIDRHRSRRLEEADRRREASVSNSSGRAVRARRGFAARTSTLPATTSPTPAIAGAVHR